MDYHLKAFLYKLIHALVVVCNFSSTTTTYRICGTPLPPQHDVNPRLMISHMSVVMLEQQYYIRPHSHYTFMLEKGEIARVDLFVTY